jgi:hypothetical protein
VNHKAKGKSLMPDDRFHVKLNGLDAEEIAAYAFRMLHCADCKVGPGRKCTGAARDKTVCRSRFVDAVKALGETGERAIRQEFEKFSRVNGAGIVCHCKRCAEWHPAA